MGRLLGSTRLLCGHEERWNGLGGRLLRCVMGDEVMLKELTVKTDTNFWRFGVEGYRIEVRSWDCITA